MRKIEKHVNAVNSTSGLRSVPDPKAAAKALQEMGIKGDTVLAHISPREATLLDVLSDGKLDGGGRNPRTGLPAFDRGDSDDSDSDSPGDQGPGGSSGPGGEGVGPTGHGADSPTGPGTAGGGNGIGGDTSFGNFAQDPSMRAGAPESTIGFAESQPNWAEYDFNGYAPQNTAMRALQEMWSPSAPVAGRFDPPSQYGPGYVGTAAGMLSGGLMAGAIGLGGALGRAQSPDEQAKSMAETAALGAQNSTGQDRDSSTGLDFASLDARAGGAREGARAGTDYLLPSPTAPATTGPDSWDEAGFLQRNPEVAKAVEAGTWTSGRSFNLAYKNQAGTNYDSAKALGLVSPYRDDMLAARPGQAVPYRG